MILCPYCQSELLEGTILCPTCGSSLVPEEGGERPASPPPLPQGSLREATSSDGRTTAQISPTQLRILVLNSGRTIVCPLAEVLLVGRADAAGGVFPDIDLNQDNGYMAGVSRRHARIIRRGDDFYVEDLDSMNGTFLNRNKVPVHTPVPFQDGDEIRLGNLVLRVILEEDRP